MKPTMQDIWGDEYYEGDWAKVVECPSCKHTWLRWNQVRDVCPECQEFPQGGSEATWVPAGCLMLYGEEEEV